MKLFYFLRVHQGCILAVWLLLSIVTVPDRSFGQPAEALKDQASEQQSLLPSSNPPRYLLDIHAPTETAELLRDYLDVARWSTMADISSFQLHQLVEHIPKQAQGLLEALGYFSSEIQVNLDESTQPPRITIRIQPGEPVRVTAIDLHVWRPNDTPDPETSARLLEHWSLGPGTIFSSSAWEAAKDDALLTLLVKRFPEARIRHSEARVDPSTHSAYLMLALDTGPEYTFGSIRVEGLERYPLTLVQSLAPMQPGDPYDQTLVLEYQRRLQSSDFFRSVTVIAALADAQDTVLPVQVKVSELPAKKIDLGLGYSSNTDFRTQISYEYINLLDKAIRLTATAKLESLQQSIVAGLSFPKTQEGFRYGISSEWKESDIQGVTTRTLLLDGHRQHLDGDVETVTAISFIHERFLVSGNDGEDNKALMPNVAWTIRRLDDPIEPTRGNLISVRTGAGVKALLSDQNFIRTRIHGVQYIPFGPGNQMILRGDVGSVISTSADGIPQEVLFRTGGIGSVRGYAYQSLGIDRAGAVLGARNFLVGSIELVHWLTPKWGCAVFYDRGGAADSFSDLKTVAGYGIGARWRSPAGVISVDLAYGEAVESLRLQLSVGFKF